MLSISYIRHRSSWFGCKDTSFMVEMDAGQLQRVPPDIDEIKVHCRDFDHIHGFMPTLPWVLHEWAKDRAQDLDIQLSQSPTILRQPFANQFLANVLQINSRLDENDKSAFWDF